MGVVKHVGRQSMLSIAEVAEAVLNALAALGDIETNGKAARSSKDLRRLERDLVLLATNQFTGRRARAVLEHGLRTIEQRVTQLERRARGNIVAGVLRRFGVGHESTDAAIRAAEARALLRHVRRLRREIDRFYVGPGGAARPAHVASPVAAGATRSGVRGGGAPVARSVPSRAGKAAAAEAGQPRVRRAPPLASLLL